MKIKKVLRDKVLRGVTSSGGILIFFPPIPLVPVVGGGGRGVGGGAWYMGDTSVYGGHLEGGSMVCRGNS